MDHVRAGGVCLLLLLLAAALPISVLAQTSPYATGSDGESIGTAVEGVPPTTEEKLHIMSNGQGDAITTERLMARNSGLKPLTGSRGAASPTGSEAAESAQTATASGQAESPAPVAASAAVTPAQEAPGPSQAETPALAAPAESAEAQIIPAMGQAAAQTQSEPSQTETTTAPAAEAVITPDEIPEENRTAAESSVASSNQTPAVVTPPENVTLGEVISGNASADNVTAQENVSQNESEAEGQNAAGETAEAETEAGTDRIWREGISSPNYTWTPQSFSGFFYDFKDDVGTERLTINLEKEGDDYSSTVKEGGLVYTTTAQKLEYEFGDWGEYEVIGFMADKYFAGYVGTSPEVIDEEVSLLDDEQLRKVLVDDDEEKTITSGSVLALEEGYELRIKQIDLDGNKVFLALGKDGEEIDSKVVSPSTGDLRGSTYLYEVDVGGKDTPIVMAHIANVFASAETSLVTVDGLFQISDTYASVQSSDEYGKMKITSAQGDTIEMENDNSFGLRKGSTVEIFGEVGFEVADDPNDPDVLRFAPIVRRTGTYDVRGTVIKPEDYDGKEFTWSPYNFEGFYYDIDDDIATENLTVRLSGTRIEEGDLRYEANPKPLTFEYEDWGRYEVVGFMADKYFAGYSSETKFTDPASAINEGQLRKVLVDSDDDQTIATGSVLSLEEGYELRINQVDLNGNKVFLALAKDGKEIDSKVVTPSSSRDDRSANYLYRVDMDSEKDVPIIAAHVQSVFRGTEADLATVDGLFQVSDQAESVEENEVHGEMKVDGVTTDGILMTNDGSITLGQGKTIEIMGNLKFMVADNEIKNFAPVAEKSSGGKAITLSLPEAVVDRTVTITTRSDNQALSGVQIQISGSSVGTTSAAGSLDYTPRSTGTFDVVARMTGYDDARGSLVVRTASEASAAVALQEANETLSSQLTINSPSQVLKGESFLITVVQGINQTPVDEAKIFFDNESIGNTSAQRTLTYSSNATGEHTLKAEKESYNSSSKKITVTSPVKVLSLNLPDTASAGREIEVEASLQNTGRVADSRKLELRANDQVVDSKDVTLQPGENSTVSLGYTPKDPGTYRISLDDQSRTINVEKAETSNWLIALIIVLLIAIGAGYYLYSTGELDKLKEKIQGR